jgi:phenylacetate-CoA ligase
MDEVALQVECPPELVARLTEEIHMALNVHIPIEPINFGSLPRFEMQAKRVEDRRLRV